MFASVPSADTQRLDFDLAAPRGAALVLMLDTLDVARPLRPYFQPLRIRGPWQRTDPNEENNTLLQAVHTLIPDSILMLHRMDTTHKVSLNPYSGETQRAHNRTIAETQ